MTKEIENPEDKVTTPAVEPEEQEKVKEGSEVEDSTQAVENEAGNKTENEADQGEKPDDEDSKDSEDLEDNKDEDEWNDEDPVTNMGMVRKLRNSNKSLSKRLKEKTEEFENFKKSPNGGGSEVDKQRITELEAELKTFTDKEEETTKKAALQEADLPEAFVGVLKGEEAEWRATLEILVANKPTNSKRLESDTVSSGLNKKYKSATMDRKELEELTRIVSRK